MGEKNPFPEFPEAAREDPVLIFYEPVDGTDVELSVWIEPGFEDFHAHISHPAYYGRLRLTQHEILLNEQETRLSDASAHGAGPTDDEREEWRDIARRFVTGQQDQAA